ncbi:hypothetical protein SK128_014164, partial [Halocaridina rubra]
METCSRQNKLHYSRSNLMSCMSSSPPVSSNGGEESWTHGMTSLVVSDSLGRFRVVVKKTRPNLGIAIEGGADTRQKLPRVINIAANGAAFEAGGLRVGQLILAVDGQKLEGWLDI